MGTKLRGQSFWAGLRLAASYVVLDNQKRLRSFRIGVFTVFLVVAFVTMLQSAIQLEPVIFLKWAENIVSETDVMLTPLPPQNETFAVTQGARLSIGGTALRLLNTTDVSAKLANNPNVAGVTPRWALLADVLSAQPGASNANVTCFVLVMDTVREQNIGLGRNFPYRPLGRNEAYLTASAARALGVRPDSGDEVLARVDLLAGLATAGALDNLPNGVGALNATLLATLLADAGLQLPATLDVNVTQTALGLGVPLNGTVPVTLLGTTINLPVSTVLNGVGVITVSRDQMINALLPLIQQALVLQAQFTVVAAPETPDGKWPETLGNVLGIDATYVPDLLVENFRGAISAQTAQPGVGSAILQAMFASMNPETLYAAVRSFPLQDFALQLTVMMTDRLNRYSGSLTDVQHAMIKVTDSIAEDLTVNFPALVTAPVALGMVATQFVSLYLNNIFDAVVAVLIMLSILLVYSLMLADVEEKTYEFGMLRSLGMKSKTLIQLLSLQAGSFSAPGLVIGIAVAYLLNLFVAFVIAAFVGAPVQFSLNWSAILMGVLLGTLLPAFSNILPIRRALGRTLRDSLDLYHQAGTEASIRVIKLAQLGLSPMQTAFAVIMVVIGFVTYYLVPYAFAFQSMPMFLGLLNGVLLGMLIGLTIIAQVAQPFLERLTLYALFAVCWRDRRLHGVVRKQLMGHRGRNRKTALMFTLALAFLIFAGAMFALQGSSLAANIQSQFGADMVVQATFGAPLRAAQLRQYLDYEIGRPLQKNQVRLVQGYTFVTFALDQYQPISSTSLSNLANFPSVGVDLYGVESNYLDVVYNQYYMPTELDGSFDYPRIPDGDAPDAVQALYAPATAAGFGNRGDPMDITSGDANGNIQIDQDTGEVTVPDNNGRAPAVVSAARLADETPLRVLVPEGLRSVISVDVHSKLRINPQIRDSLNSFTYQAVIRAFAKKVPGFQFTSYGTVASSTDALLPMDLFWKIIDDARDIVDQELQGAVPYDINETMATMPMGNLLVRLTPGLAKEDRETVANGLRNWFVDDSTTLTDTQSLVETTQLAVMLMQVFFGVVAAIAIALAFFLLLISFASNVKENAWESGVLRAVGLTGGEVCRVYVYEALALILSSAMLGSVIGILVACSLTLQFNLFTEMPFQFEFPTALFLVMVLLSIATAIGGSYIPASAIRKKPISHVLKGLA